MIDLELTINGYYWIVFFLVAALVPYGVEFLKYIINLMYNGIRYIGYLRRGKKGEPQAIPFERKRLKSGKILALVLTALFIFTFGHSIIESVIVIQWGDVSIWVVRIFNWTALFVTTCLIAKGTNVLADFYERHILAFGDPGKTNKINLMQALNGLVTRINEEAAVGNGTEKITE